MEGGGQGITPDTSMSYLKKNVHNSVIMMTYCLLQVSRYHTRQYHSGQPSVQPHTSADGGQVPVPCPGGTSHCGFLYFCFF